MLRNIGNDIYNNDPILNKDGVILSTRRKRVKKVTKQNQTQNNNNMVEISIPNLKDNLQAKEVTENLIKTKDCNKLPQKMPCPKCLGYYSSNYLRAHKCIGGKDESNFEGSVKTRQKLANSKQMMGLCHSAASNIVRENILPKLRLDVIGTAARFDYMIILYANKFAERYMDADQQAYVRGHMRLLAKLKIAIIEINEKIKSLIDVFRPKLWPIMLEAINHVSELDSERNRFLVIYNAETLPMLIRKCIKILKRHSAINEDDSKMKLLESFENVFENDVEFKVSYTAHMSRKESGRHNKAKKLPESNDILTFENFLKMKREVSLQHFANNGRLYEHYLNILQKTAILILLYNRRRVGEISKILLLDFINGKKADPSSEFFRMLSTEEQDRRLKYMRIDIQGKRADGVGSLYLSQENEKSLELIVKYRTLFNISSTNKYLFAIPNGDDNKDRHTKLCELISKLSYEYSKQFQKIDSGSIRGTLLRKQLATYNATINNDHATNIMTKHLGHTRSTHDKCYKRVTDQEQNIVTSTLDIVNGTAQVQIDSTEILTEILANDVDQQENRQSNLICDKTFSCSSKEKLQTKYSKEEKDEKSKIYHNYLLVIYIKYLNLNFKLKILISVKCSRKSWSNSEIDAFTEAFANQLKSRRYANKNEIVVAKKHFPCLKNRSDKVISARFSNLYHAQLKSHKNI